MLLSPSHKIGSYYKFTESGYKAGAPRKNLLGRNAIAGV